MTVRVTDVNDKKPRFESTHERVIISEDLSVGSSITVVRAIDDDAVGVNLKLRYILEEVLKFINFKQLSLISSYK